MPADRIDHRKDTRGIQGSAPRLEDHEEPVVITPALIAMVDRAFPPGHDLPVVAPTTLDGMVRLTSMLAVENGRRQVINYLRSFLKEA